MTSALDLAVSRERLDRVWARWRDELPTLEAIVAQCADDPDLNWVAQLAQLVITELALRECEVEETST
jgi:hypothetical protein